MVTRNRETGVHTAIAVPILRRKYSMKLPGFTPKFLAVNKEQNIVIRSIKFFCRWWIRVAVYFVIPVCILGALAGGGA